MTDSQRAVLPYKQRSSLEERKSLVQEMAERNPPRLVVILSPTSQAAKELTISNKEMKFLPEASAEMKQIFKQMQDYLKLTADMSLFIYHEGKLLKSCKC